MALRNPPSWLQNGSHPAENDRLTSQAMYYTTGIVGLTTLVNSLKVTQNSPAGMSVLVDSGWAAIVGTTQANMGVYVSYNDASTTATITTANPSNPRIDRVCLTVSDAYYTGSLNQVAINVVAGTPAASPVAPATPANSISLATIAVGAGVTSILTANITDTRVETTTLLPAGDITAVTAGTGLSGGGSSGAVTLTIDTSVTADLTTAQTLTNKTLTAPIINLALNAQTGTTYTFALTDNGKLVTASNASAQTYSIPTNATTAYPTGTQINIIQIGAGQVTIQAASSGTTTVSSTGATATAPKLRAQYSSATCIKASTDLWYVVGDIA
jgi:hypothetical protein